MPESVSDHIDRHAARVRSESEAKAVQNGHGAWVPMMVGFAALFWIAVGLFVLHLLG